jgi:hypothetical protein
MAQDLGRGLLLVADLGTGLVGISDRFGRYLWTSARKRGRTVECAATGREIRPGDACFRVIANGKGRGRWIAFDVISNALGQMTTQEKRDG